MYELTGGDTYHVVKCKIQIIRHYRKPNLIHVWLKSHECKDSKHTENCGFLQGEGAVDAAGYTPPGWQPFAFSSTATESLSCWEQRRHYIHRPPSQIRTDNVLSTECVCGGFQDFQGYALPFPFTLLPASWKDCVAGEPEAHLWPQGDLESVSPVVRTVKQKERSTLFDGIGERPSQQQTPYSGLNVF